MISIYQQISANQKRTWLIFFIFIVIFTGFFYLLGKLTDSANIYLIIGFVISLLSSIGSYFYSDKIVLFTVRAIPAEKKKHFNFYTVTENLSIADKVFTIESFIERVKSSITDCAFRW